RGRDPAALGQGGEVHEPDAVRERPAGAVGGLDRQPGLADPADAGQRDQPGRRQPRPDPADLLPPADEAGHRGGEVADRSHHRTANVSDGRFAGQYGGPRTASTAPRRARSGSSSHGGSHTVRSIMYALPVSSAAVTKTR